MSYQTQPSQKTPYVGPVPFQIGQPIYGRELEISELASRLTARRVVLLHSPSGAGKTSLIQAGLIPRLEQEKKFLRLPVIHLSRVPLAGEMEAGGNRFILSCVHSLEDKLPEGQRLSAENLARLGRDPGYLADYLADYCQRYAGINQQAERRRSLLIFDQFEEILTIAPADRASKEQFFTELMPVLENNRYWVLFAIREDFLARLDPYLGYFPDRLSAHFQLDFLGKEAAHQAIVEPAKSFGVEVSNEAVDKLVHDLSLVRVLNEANVVVEQPGMYVEPVQLQVVCERLWRSPRPDPGKITLEDVKTSGKVVTSLASYYAEAVKSAAECENVSERNIRQWFEVALIAEGGLRQPVPQGSEIEFGVTPDCTGLLVDKYLIRFEVQSGTLWYRLAHDRLVEAIRLDNARWNAENLSLLQRQALLWEGEGRPDRLLLRGTDLDAAEKWMAGSHDPLNEAETDLLERSRQAHKEREAQRKEREAQLAKDRENARRINRYFKIAVSVAVVALIATVFAIYFYQEARKGEARANANAARAEAASTLAVANAAAAEMASAQALAEKDRAEQMASISQARQLAAQSRILQSDKLIPALLLSAQGYLTDNDFETRSSLLSTVQCCSNALVSLMSGHKDSVWDVAFSPDETLLVSSGTDGAVIVWDVATRREVTRLTNPLKPGTIFKLAFSPKDPILATADSTGSIVLYSTETWQQVGKPWRSHASSVYAIKFSDDGKFLVSGGEDGRVIVWNVARGQRVRTFFQHNARVWDVAIDVELQTVASVSRDKTLRLWDLNGWDSADPLTMDTVNILTSVAFIPDKDHTLLVTGDANRNVIVWNLRPWIEKRARPQQTKSQPITANGVVWTLKFLPGEGLTFFAGVENGALKKVHIEVKDIFTDTIVTTEILGISGHIPGIYRSAVSLNQEMIATAGLDGLVGLWRVKDTAGIVKHPANVNSLQVLNDRNLVSSIDTAGNLFQWDYTRPGVLKEISLESGRIQKSATSPDGTKVVYVLDDANKNSIVIWDTQTQQVLAQSTDFLTLGKINCIAISPDGTLIATGDVDGDVILRKFADNELVTIGRYHSSDKETFHSLVFSPDGKTLAGGTLYVWDVEPELKLRYGQLQGTGGFARSVAINPADPNELAVGSENGVLTLWDLRQRTVKHFIRLGTYRINSVAYSPDGRVLAVAEESTNLIYLYDVMTGQRYGRYFREHDSRINTLAFSPDGSALFSASSDGTIIAHDLRIDKWLERACTLANRNLTQDEWRLYVGDVPYSQACPSLP